MPATIMKSRRRTNNPASPTQSLSDHGHPQPAKNAVSPNSRVQASNQIGHLSDVTQARHADSISALREMCAARKAAIRSQIRLMNASRAFVRRALGWTADGDDREKINARAAEIVKDIESGHSGYETPVSDADSLEHGGQVVNDPQFPVAASAHAHVIRAVAPFVLTLAKAREPIDEYRSMVERSMTSMVRMTSNSGFWSYVDSVRGLGDLSVAIIIGEAGDLAGYSNPGKLWKRFGLAVFSGVAQGRKAEGMTAQDWVERGYAPSRRSAMWVIGDCIIKSNRDGEYRKVYIERKAYEAERDPAMSKMHAHRRAQRYMEKRLLRDLWQAWRGHRYRDTQFKPAPPSCQ